MMPAKKATKKRRITKPPSKKQLAARRKFIAMVRAKSKAAKKKGSKKATNPRGKHLAGATAKQQRQYEAIKKSERKRSLSLKESKRIAAATVRSRAKNPSATEKLLEINKIYQKHRAVIAKKFDKMTLDQAHAEMKRTGQRSIQDAIHKLSMDAARPEIRAIEQNPARRRNKTIIKAHTIKHLDVSKTHNPKRQNPRYTVEAKPKYTRTVKEDVTALTRGSAIRKVRRGVPGPKNIYSYSVTKNPKAKKVSPAVKKIRESFTGMKSRKTTTMHVPNGTPKNLAKLGRLVSIKTEKGVINPASGVGLVLCSDAKGKLHIASTKPARAKNPAMKQVYGKVREIEYETAKPHLGYKKKTIFFHKMGEEGGTKPTLFSDGQYLRLRGGSYKITPNGITN